jgi:hypothetical protein
MGKVIPGRGRTDTADTSPRLRTRGAKSGAGPPYQLKVSLLEIEPEIWRQLRVPGGASLDRLHEIFQVAMGWTNSHLHQFSVGDIRYGVPDPDFDQGDVRDERNVRLCEVATRANGSFVYEYDFGDGWEHRVVVEKILTPEERSADIPVCLAGARACPPEDCGGVPGYESFLEVRRDPTHEDHQAMLKWVGGSFDPEAFDPNKVNKRLRRLR